MKSDEYWSESEEDTHKFAHAFSKQIAKGDILLLYGDLGAGKTAFTRALIRSLYGNENIEVPSPTFTLVQTYESPKGILWHFDLYRLNNQEEIYELGWEEALEDGIVIIEWPDRIKSLLPKKHYQITITTGDNETSRHFKIERHNHHD